MSVHDNQVYAHVVDYEGCRIVLHTVYSLANLPEFTDIVFAGVVAHHFEYQAFQGSGQTANILFDAEESESAGVIERYADMLAAAKRYGWPVLKYNGPDDLADQLAATGARCYELHGSCGLSGFVFAASMEFRRRRLRANLSDVESDAPPDPGQ